MAVIFKYRCPSCEEVFKTPLTVESIKYCVLCGAYVGPDDPDFVPSQMNIGTNKGKSPDMVYRQMEETSAYRAEMAGNPDLKITDLKDSLREGDVAAKTVRNTVTDYMDTAKEQLKGSGMESLAGGYLPNIQGMVAQAQTGPERRDGSFALGAIQGGNMRGGPPRLPIPPGQGFGGR